MNANTGSIGSSDDPKSGHGREAKNGDQVVVMNISGNGVLPWAHLRPLCPRRRSEGWSVSRLSCRLHAGDVADYPRRSQS